MGRRGRLTLTWSAQVEEGSPGAEPGQGEYRQLLNLKGNEFPN